MRKHKKKPVPGPKKPLAGAPEKPFAAEPEFAEIENRLTNDDETFDSGKKETSGIWFLVIVAALLLLVFLQHWLRQ